MVDERKEEKKEVKPEKQKEAVFVDVSTQSVKMVQLPDGSIISLDEVILATYNEVQKIKKSI